MPARESEALVLRAYPYREADLIVSFFARDRGKLRGIAKGVRRPKSRFGSGLERLAHSRLSYFQKQTVELVRIDRSELVGPPLLLRTDYPSSVALDFVAEVAEYLLPEHEPNDAYFRLLVMMLEEIWSELNTNPPAGAGVPAKLWRALTYFSLWSLRLGGWMPPLDVCMETGRELEPGETTYYQPSEPGLLSAEAAGREARKLTPESRVLAQRMLRLPLPAFHDGEWSAETAVDLRQFLFQRLEAHLERRLTTLSLLRSFDRAAPSV